jgi:hypothetical protein
MKSISQKLSEVYCNNEARQAKNRRVVRYVNTHKQILAFLLFLLLFTGCSSANFARITMSKYPSKSEAVDIPVLSGDSDLVYERIGAVFVYGDKSLTRELINVKLKKQAKEVGADAVIFTRYGEIESSEYFKSYGSSYVDFEQAKKKGSGSWLMKRKPVGAGLAIRYKTREKLH